MADDERTSSAGMDETSRAGALRVLGDVLRWERQPDVWGQVVGIVESMAAALAAADPHALSQATVRMVLLGSARATRMGATPEVPPPEPVRERLYSLIHSLGSVDAATHGDGEGRTDAQEDRDG